MPNLLRIPAFSWLTLLFLGLMVAACGRPVSRSEGKPRVVASTTMIGDMTRQIAGDRVEIQTILKPGQDPHIYKPVPSDPQAVTESDLVLLNGLRLEEYIEKMVRAAVRTQPVVLVSDGIEPLQSEGEHAAPDPHIWFDVAHAQVMVANIMKAVSALDPQNAAAYRGNGERYLERLRALDEEVKKTLSVVPPDRRKLVTSHDAFSYFGKRYGFEVLAVQGISTDAAAQARDMATLIDRVRSERISAIFIETSVNPKLIEQVAREAGVKIGGKLYSDSLGEPGTPADTYVGMVQENARTIAEALR